MSLNAEKLMNYISFAKENDFDIEYIGLNFLTEIESFKIYYKPSKSLHTKLSSQFIENIMECYFGGIITECYKNYLKQHEKHNLLDISFKDTNDIIDIRCSIRFSTKYNQITNLYSFIRGIGFHKTTEEIDRIREFIHFNYCGEIDPLYVIGFTWKNGTIATLKTYFRFSTLEIIDDYANFNKHHTNDDAVFYNIVMLLGIDKELTTHLYQIFSLLNKSKLFIDFMGIDFDAEGDKYFKIYFKKSDNCDVESAINKLLDLEISKTESKKIIKNIYNLYSLNFKTIDGVGVAFNETKLLKYQIYFGE